MRLDVTEDGIPTAKPTAKLSLEDGHVNCYDSSRMYPGKSQGSINAVVFYLSMEVIFSDGQNLENYENGERERVVME